MKIFKARRILIFLGLVLLALFIWFAGPYFAFAEFKPLESPIARLIAILLMLLVWAIVVLVKMFRAHRAGAKLADAVVAQKPAAEAAAATGDTAKLRKDFEEAVATLKKTQAGGRSFYELPWYVIIGPPGSGKTTSLIYSGLKFPLEQRFGKAALKGVGGTRNCDWWFTDDAVLLDTAGRFTSQDSDAAADSAEWGEFLALLMKYRKRRPLNGVIVTLSASDLMTHTPAEREKNVSDVRRRLDELNRHLKVRLPVYLMVTKCDLISGFTEYFDDLGSEGRAQVWGMTFKAERSLAGTAAEDFPREFDALIERLNQRLFGRIEEERDVRRRTAAFAFPQQIAGLRELISAFVSEVFAATRFDGRLLLRGVYFTSGTQTGTPIDRLMAAIGRGFAIPETARPPEGAAGSGKAYFIEKMLRDVLFAEAGLAGVNRARELKKAAFQLAAYAALLLIAVLGVIALSVSFSRNKSYLADVAVALDQLNTVKMPTAQQTLPEMAPGLDALRHVADVANRYKGQLAWSLRWGLFQGAAVGEEASEAYQRELNGSLLPQIGNEFKQRLQAAAAHPDVLYEYLKVYLMLGQPKHLDKPQLTYVVNHDWQDSFAEQPDLVQSLNTHLNSLIEDQDTLRPLPLDETLVAQSRSNIRDASLPKLMYNQLKLSHLDDTSHDVRLDIAAGNGAERVLSRKSGKRLSEPVPGLYTRTVFDQITALGPAELAKTFEKEAWVMGDTVLDMQGSIHMASLVMDVYADDYIANWDGILNDIQVVPIPTLAQANEVLTILGGPDSPLRLLLATVAANTDMSKPAEGSVVSSGIAAATKAALGSMSKILGSNKPATPTVTPAQRITQHFASIDQLVAGPPGGAPIDRVITQVAQIQQKISNLGGGVAQTNPLDALAKSGQDASVKSLKQQAGTLPAPIGALVAAIGGRSESLAVDSARGTLEELYREQVVQPCNLIVAGHYPFVATSANDVQPLDFARLFGSGGIFDGFFKMNLAQLVDTTRSPWVWKPDSTGPAGQSTPLLRQFEAAQQILQNYMGSGGQPEQVFSLTAGDLDQPSARFTLELDGQTLENTHGPARAIPMRWPGPAPGTAAVTFVDFNGAHSNLAFTGPWAWFRLLDAATVKAETDVRFDATFQSGGHQATVIIEAVSMRNAYQKSVLHQFRCAL